MDVLNEYNITFEYTDPKGNTAVLKWNDGEIEKKEAEWREKIISNHKGTLVPYNIVVHVRVSNDWCEVIRKTYVEDRPIEGVAPAK